MTLNLIKLCVGVSKLEELAAFQARRLEQNQRIFHVTRMVPRRDKELLDGGSLYWVIKGNITARQQLTDIEVFTDMEGIRRCRLVLDQQLVPVRPVPRRAFQGWRYLEAADAPPDLPKNGSGADMSDAMRAQLVELGLI